MALPVTPIKIIWIMLEFHSPLFSKEPPPFLIILAFQREGD
jgi:hypothetical protein